MKGGISIIDAVCKGYTVGEAEMRFTPSGQAVCTVRIGCGGNEKRKGTFVEVVAWEEVAEALNKLADKKGLYVIATGVISQRKWQYDNKWYEKIELIYLKELQVEKNKKLVDIPIPEYKRQAVAASGDGSGDEETVGEEVPF